MLACVTQAAFCLVLLLPQIVFLDLAVMNGITVNFFFLFFSFFEAVLILHFLVSITLLNIRPICQFRQMCVGTFVHIFFRER